MATPVRGSPSPEFPPEDLDFESISPAPLDAGTVSTYKVALQWVQASAEMASWGVKVGQRYVCTTVKHFCQGPPPEEIELTGGENETFEEDLSTPEPKGVQEPLQEEEEDLARQEAASFLNKT